MSARARKAKRLPKVLTDDELAALLRQPNPHTLTGLRNKAMLKVMAYGGLRVSEVVALTTTDLRRQDGRLFIEVRDGKGGVDRTVPLPDHAAETLETWLSRRKELGVKHGPVFCTVSHGRNVHPVATSQGFGEEMTETALVPGEPLNQSYIRAMVTRLARRAGIEKRVSPHILRHTAATRLLKADGNLRRVQEFLGHADVSTTEIYTEVLAEDVADAVERVSDAEAPAQEQRPTHAEEVAAQLLAALPAEIRVALAEILA